MIDAKNKIEIGQKLYFSLYDDVFPDFSDVSEATVSDVSQKGLVYIEKDDNWYDPADPEERLFLTREEAEEELERLKNGR